MIDQLLFEIGLSPKEATMYVTLLRHGTKPTSFLSQKAGFNRGTGYVILHALLEKGLATKSTKRNVQYFTPLDPKNLVSYLDRKEKQIESSKEKVQAMMGQLTAITNPLTSKPKIEFFDGPEGARTVLERTLQSQEKTLRAFSSLPDLMNFVGADFFEEYSNRRIANGYAFLAIRTREKDKAAIEIDPRSKRHTSSVQDNRTVRYAPEDLAFPVTMYMFDNKLAIISSREENFSVLIESKELMQMQKKIFDIVWGSLERKTIKVGILHSLSGTMAISERSLVDAELLAIEEINEKGGVLGKHIEPVVMDGASDWKTFANQAERLIVQEGVCCIFGGWTSASRKTMLPVIEKHDHLLWYPVQYEGLEQSPNVIYTGAAPNQQVIPAVDWVLRHLGKKIFLIGSDYVFPRSANEIAKGRIGELGGEVVGESYRKLGETNFSLAVRKIKETKPEAIINTINGDSNIAFFEQLRKAGITSKKIPTMSLSIAEEEISRMDPGLVEGDFATWNYFQSLRTKANDEFVKRFKNKYGQHRVTDDPIEAAYSNMYLFAGAVKKAKSEETDAVRQAARGLEIQAPSGTIKIDPDNQHVHKNVYVGEIGKYGQFTVIWQTDAPIKPDPYPPYKSQKEWANFLSTLYDGWGGNWSKM